MKAFANRFLSMAKVLFQDLTVLFKVDSKSVAGGSSSGCQNCFTLQYPFFSFQDKAYGQNHTQRVNLTDSSETPCDVWHL
jgi:hypothetical protein